MSDVLLSVENLEAWYDDAKVLHGMSFDLKKGQVLWQKHTAEMHLRVTAEKDR
jgi:ABC-type phosphonate transport system ATPase subunit